MSIQQMKKDILELKRVADIENKQSENNRLKNMTDEELQEELKKELANLGFESEEEFYTAAKRYFAENGLKTTFDNNYQFENYVFEILFSENHLSDFVLKYGNFGAD